MRTFNKWYFRVDFNDNSILEFTTPPAQAGNCEDLVRRNDIELSDLTWAGVNEGYLTQQAALSRGFSEEHLNSVKLSHELNVQLYNTGIRKHLLDDASHEDIEKVWGSFSELDKNEIITYRQQLNDLVIEDAFNPIWPTCPSGLVNFYENK